MPSNISLRDFQQEDLHDLADLMTELGYPTTPQEMQGRMSSIISNKNYKTIVATSRNQVVGVIGLVSNFLWEQNGFYVRIQALVVQQNFRRQGVGQLLIAQAEKWAIETGAAFIALNCGDREARQAAHQFYTKMHFERKSFGYVKQLT